jgi:hypothetical protein
MVAALGNGFIVDWNFRRHAAAAKLEPQDIKPLSADELEARGFHIVRTRIQIAVPEIAISCVAMLCYAWSMQYAVHPAFPFCALFFFGLTGTAAYSCLNVLIVDLSHGSPATATAANNLVRCSLAAGGTAGIMSVIGALGVGWAFTALAGGWLALMPLLLVAMVKEEKKDREDI